MDIEREFILEWYARQLLVKGITEAFQLRLTEETFGSLSCEFEELIAELLIRSGLAGITREFPRHKILRFYSPLIYRQDETIQFRNGPNLEFYEQSGKKVISFPHELSKFFAPVIASRVFLWLLEERIENSLEIKFPVFDLERVRRQGRVMVVGAGGLGGPLIKTLLDLGLRDLAVVEPGSVKLNNLHRQILYDYGDVGYLKAEVLQKKLSRAYTSARIRVYNSFFSESLLRTEKPDLVISCVDNFSGRYSINDACYRSGIPYIDGAVEEFSGYVMYRDRTLPCYRCFMGDERRDNSAPKGILPFTSYLGGMVQAAIAVDFLNRNKPYESIFWFDLRNSVFEELEISRRSECKVCQ